MKINEPPPGKSNKVVSEQVRLKPVCTVKEAGLKLEILEEEVCYPCSENKGADQLRVFLFAYADCWLSHEVAQMCSTFFFPEYKISRRMGKPTICLGENKGADQLRGNREADQRLCFRYTDSTLPLLFKSELSSF